MDDKAEAFTECLLGDIFGCFAEALQLNIEFSTEQDESRFVPEEFFCTMVSFSKFFVDQLMPDISRMPILLCYSEDFLRNFTNSVCLRLIKDDDPEVAFLKVISFLLVIISSSFVNRCYRPLDDIPGILRKLLKEHLKTNFYEENRFNDILSQCDELKDEGWYESTLEEMRSYMKDALQKELAAFETPSEHIIAFQKDRSKISIIDVRLKEKSSPSESKLCPYCDAECILLLKAFWKPKIAYKPECLQM